MKPNEPLFRSQNYVLVHERGHGCGLQDLKNEVAVGEVWVRSSPGRGSGDSIRKALKIQYAETPVL